MTPLYASAVVVVWGLVALRGGSVTRAAVSVALWLRACAIYCGAVVQAIGRDHRALWAWSRERARREV